MLNEHLESANSVVEQGVTGTGRGVEFAAENKRETRERNEIVRRRRGTRG